MSRNVPNLDLVGESEFIRSFVAKCKQTINAENVTKLKKQRIQTSARTVREKSPMSDLLC